MEIKSLPDDGFRRYFWIDKKLEVNIWIRNNKNFIFIIYFLIYILV